VGLKTLDLLDRISEHDAGRRWWKALSSFQKLACLRIRREAEAEMRSKLGENNGPSNQAMMDNRIS